MKYYNPTITEFFPDIYMPVKILSKNKKEIGVGILVPSNKIHCLYFFGERDQLVYTANEVKECYILLDPVDGIEYDLRKVLC
jgi:hypothetical protein